LNVSPRPAPFPLVEGKRKGYTKQDVDNFLDQVKRTYEGDGSLQTPVRSSDIRNQSFSLTKKGYDPRFVDAALDRLEEVLFNRERAAFQSSEGLDVWNHKLQQLQNDLFGRIGKPRGERFARRAIFSSGYRISQVDAVMDQLADRFQRGLEIRVNDVRTVRFYPQHRGYDEAQVDAFLDAIVEYMLAQR